MAPPTSRKEVLNFIGVVNYYRNMCKRLSHKLLPLTKLKSIKRNFKWTEVEQDVLDENKRIVARDTLLTYPGFNELFKIHTDAIVFLLVAVISQKFKPIYFYSRKLSGFRQRYAVMER